MRFIENSSRIHREFIAAGYHPALRVLRKLLRKREEKPEDNVRMPSRVLVADNHPLFRAALGSLLREHSGLEVVAEAADGREALECCRRFKPDLVVMDVRMPEVDGLEATRAIKQEHPHTVVLVLNGYGTPDTLVDALEAGAAGYILKSATPQQISEAIQKVLEGSSLVDPEIATQLLLRLLDKPRNEAPSLLAPKRPPSGEHAAGTLPVALAPREVEVLQLIAWGYTNRQISQSLLVSVSSVKKYVQRIITKLGVSDRTQAAVKASNMGLLDDQGQE